MQKTECKLTVFFDDPFWVGVCERVCGGKLEACKITFGAEPRDHEVYNFVLQSWERLRFSPPVGAEGRQGARPNPKRMQRQVTRQLAQRGAGTKSQQALQLQREEGKLQRKQTSRRKREEEKDRRFALRQQKRKAKHRGR